MPQGKRLIQLSPWRKVALALAGLLLPLAGITYLTYADLTQPLHASVTYPLSLDISGARVSGSAEQQVFQIGSSAADGPVFGGLNPKTGTLAANGGTLNFLFGSQNAVNAHDFIYLIQVTGGPDSISDIGTLRVGICKQTSLTSVGYFAVTNSFTPSSSTQTPGTSNAEVSFNFDTQPIPQNGKSAVLFFTSPDPPGLHPTYIGGGGAASLATMAVYGPCPAAIALDQKIGLSPTGPFIDGPLSIIEGTPIYYQIKITNSGQTPLTNITISDAELKNGGNLTSDFFSTLPGQLAAGSAITKVFGPFPAISTTPTPGVTVKGLSHASVGAEYHIPNQNGTPSGFLFAAANSDDVMLNVGEQADLSVTNSDSPDPVLLGKNVTYTLTVTNHGPSAAANVVLTNTLPSGVMVVSSPCPLANGAINCNLGTLAKDASATVTIVIKPTATGTITNMVQVISSTNDPDSTSNTALQDTVVAPVADLSLAATHNGDFTIGTVGSFILTVSNAANAGPVTGPVTVTDALPGNLTLTAFNGAGWSCAGLGTANVSCANSSPLAAGGSLLPLTLQVNVGLGTPTGASSITNAPQVSTPDELNTANNSASDPTTVNKATPQINWSNPADIVYGTPLSGTQLNATASFNGSTVAGSFTYTPASGAVLNAGDNQPLSVIFTPTDTADFNSANASVQINVLKATPQINWSNPADIGYGTPLTGTQLNATASFGGITVAGTFVYAPAAGTVLNAGNNQPLSVNFTPTDTTNFNSANTAVQINVVKATPTINWSNPADIIYGLPLGSVQLNATATFNGNAVPGAFVYTPAAGTVLNAGNNQPLSVSFTPTDTVNFNDASASVQINVLRATPNINWSDPASILYGTPLSGTQLNATASFNSNPVPGSFVYTPAAGTVLNAGNGQTLAASFAPTDTANFNNVNASVHINVLKATPAINWNNPADIVYGTPLGNAQLNAIASFGGNSVPGTFVYLPAAGTVLNAGSGQILSASFTPTDAANFNSANAAVQINVVKATPQINWSNPADIGYGTPLTGTQFNATASFGGITVPGAFVYLPVAGTILNAGSGQMLATSFTPTDTANFNSVNAAVQINVLKATPAINWSNPADIIYGTPLSGAQLNATAIFGGSSVPGAFIYTPSAGTILNAGSHQSLSVSFLPTDAANFNSGNASVQINVLKAVPQINWSNPADIVYGTPLGNSQLNATASFNGNSVSGTFVYLPAAGTVLNAGNGQMLATSFTPADTVNFNSVNASVQINVLKATPNINWSNPANIVYGTPLGSTQLNAAAIFNGNTVPGAFVYTPASGTVLNAGNNQPLSVVFTPTDTANFNGANASVQINVLKATPQINWSNPADIVYGTPLGSSQLNATAVFNSNSVPGAFVYTPATGTVLNAGNNQSLSVSFTPTDTTNFNGANASVQLNVLKATPQINWNNPANIVYGTPLSSTQLNATAVFNSNSVPGTFVYTPAAGTVLNAGSGQTLSVSFTPTDTVNFNNANASVQLNVLKATPIITWSNPANIVYGTPLSGTQLNATASFSGNSVPGSFAYTPASGTVLNAGNNQSLSVIFTPTDVANFNGANASVQLNVLKATPQINWSNPADIVYGTPLGNSQLNAAASFNSNSVPGAFVYTPAAGTVLNAGNNQSLSVSFTPTDTANFNGANASAQLNVLKATPQINWSNPADIVYGTPLGSSQLNATASFGGNSVPGSLVYTPASGAILNAGNGQTLSVSFTPTDTVNFNHANASVQLNILKATPTIAWSNPADIVYGTPLGNSQLNATASFNGNPVPGSFAYTPASATILNAANGQTLSVNFTPNNTTNFNNVTASVQINVLKATPQINWSNPADIVYGTALGSTQLNAAASFNGNSVPGAFVYTPPSGTILNAGNQQPLSVSFTPTDTVNFNGKNASVQINVLKATPQTIWPNPADIVHGTPLGSAQLNAAAQFNGASLPGTFVYTPPSGTILNAGPHQQLAANFTPADTANFNAAPANAQINVLGGSSLGVSASINTIDPCVGPNTTLTITAKVTHNGGVSPQLDNPGPEFVGQLPSLVTAVAGSCTSTGGTCSISGSQVTWSGSVGVGQTITISYKVKVKSVVVPGNSLCFLSQVHYDSDSYGTNNVTVSTTNCVQADCNLTPCTGPDCPMPGPGIALPVGSVLVYNFYSSQIINPNVENTRISITNTEASRTAYVHLFFIDGSNCSVADSFICLTPNQTASFLASDIDPGVSGYIVAVAVDRETGCPTSFNYLIGSEYIKLASGHAANLKAESFSALYDGTMAGCDVNSSMAVLNFNGLPGNYSPAPRTLALDYLPSPADGNSTLLILNSFGGNLASSASLMGDLFGLLYDDLENPYSFVFSGRCQFREKISNSFPRTTPRPFSVMPPGRSGWIRLLTVEDRAILGAAINFNPMAAASVGAFNQGHNLHKLAFTTAASLTIPVLPPSC